MKQSITRKLFLNSSLLRVSFIAGTILWVICQIPLVWFFLRFYASNEMEIRASRQIATENLLLDTFKNYARFGDLVNARGQTLKLGRPFGVLDLELCRGTEDLLPRIGEVRCKDGGIQGHVIPLSDGPLSARFLWHAEASDSLPVVLAAILTSATLSLLLIAATTAFTYLLLAKQIKALCLRISAMKSDSGEMSIPKDTPEFRVIVETVLRLREDLGKSHAENLSLATRAALVDLASRVSHDIRSPLSALRMLRLPEMSSEQAQILRAAVERIGGIADSMLLGLREKRRERIPPAASDALVDVSRSMESLVAEKRISAESGRKIRIELRAEPNAYSAVDADEFARILSNLIDNGVDASSQGDVVTLSLDIYESELLIRVSDVGCGIPANILPKLFTEGATFGKKDGNGLGLFHAKQAVESWSGRIDLQSREGLGTIVTIRLPRSDRLF